MTRTGEWRAGRYGNDDCGVYVPFVYGRPCLAPSPWAHPHSCTRNYGHTGRHVAYAVTGRVMGVWHGAHSEA